MEYRAEYITYFMLQLLLLLAKSSYGKVELESNSWSCHSGCKKFCLPFCKKSCCSARSQTYQEGMFKDLLKYQDSLSPSLIPPVQSVLFMSPAPPAHPAPSMPLATPAPPAPSQASLGQLFNSAFQQTTEGSPTAVQCGQWCPKSCAPTCQSQCCSGAYMDGFGTQANLYQQPYGNTQQEYMQQWYPYNTYPESGYSQNMQTGPNYQSGLSNQPSYPQYGENYAQDLTGNTAYQDSNDIYDVRIPSAFERLRALRKTRKPNRVVNNVKSSKPKTQIKRYRHRFYDKNGDPHDEIVYDGARCDPSCRRLCEPSCRFECCVDPLSTSKTTKNDIQKKPIPAVETPLANQEKLTHPNANLALNKNSIITPRQPPADIGATQLETFSKQGSYKDDLDVAMNPYDQLSSYTQSSSYDQSFPYAQHSPYVQNLPSSNVPYAAPSYFGGQQPRYPSYSSGYNNQPSGFTAQDSGYNGKQYAYTREQMEHPQQQSRYRQQAVNNGQQFDQTGLSQKKQQCSSTCPQACAPSCSKECCDRTSQPTQTCRKGCPSSCAPECKSRCCWDRRRNIIPSKV